MKKNFLFCLLSVLSVALFAGNVTIVKDGKNPALIVLPENPTQAERLAAEELRTNLSILSKAKFKVCNVQKTLPAGPKIYLGKHKKLPVLEQGKFLIRTMDNDLYLYGGGLRGTLSATYRFLEDFAGIRFMDVYGYIYYPADRRTIQVSADKVYSEGLPYRSVMTCCYTNVPQSDHGLVQFGQNLLLPSKQFSFLNRAVNLGKGNHSIHKFMPPAKYFKSHPEYYSMEPKGKRAASQMCFSNKEMRREFTKNVLEICLPQYRKQSKNVSRMWIEISAMDSPGMFCHCPECKKLAEKYQTPCGAFYEYLAELCIPVKKAMPNAMVATLLYRKEQTEKPPVGLKIPDNFLGIFAPIDLNFFAPMDHSSNRDTLENLRRWCKTTQNIWVWYYPDSYGTASLPYSGLRRSIRDFQMMKKAGITGAYYEHDATPVNSVNFADLETYVLMRLFSGYDKDPELLINEFITLYYGKAAPMVKKYFDELEGLMQKAAARGICGYYSCSPVQLGYMTEENLKRWANDFDKMEQLVKNDPKRFFHIQLLRRAVDQTRLERMTAPIAERRKIYERCAATLKRIARERRLSNRFNDSMISNLNSIVEMKTPVGLGKVNPEDVRRIQYQKPMTHIKRVQFPYGIYCYDYTAVSDGKGKIRNSWKLLGQRYLQSKEIKPDQYAFYKIGTFRITDAARVMVTPAGYFFVDIGRFCTDPNIVWDVFFSLKFEGPAVPGSKAKTNKVSCNEITLIKHTTENKKGSSMTVKKGK